MDVRLQLWGKILSPTATALLEDGTPLTYVRTLYMSAEQEPYEVQRRLVTLMADMIDNRQVWSQLVTFLDKMYHLRGIAPWDVAGVFAGRFKGPVGEPQAMPTLSYLEIATMLRRTTNPDVGRRTLPVLEIQHLSMLLGGWLTCDEDEIRDSTRGQLAQTTASDLLAVCNQAPGALTSGV